MFNDADTGVFDPDNLVTRPPSKSPHDDKPVGSLGIHQHYSADISLFGIDEFNKKIIEFKYIGAFPTKLDSIEFDYQTESEIESGVTFAFSRLIASLV